MGMIDLSNMQSFTWADVNVQLLQARDSFRHHVVVNAR
jgi:hypothetical protein